MVNLTKLDSSVGDISAYLQWLTGRKEADKKKLTWDVRTNYIGEFMDKHNCSRETAIDCLLKGTQHGTS